MKKRFRRFLLSSVPIAYAAFLCVDLCFGDPPASPAPGSPGDTLSREDKRMAYLVYQRLDSNGMIVGADRDRGRDLFLRNCRPCHGEDGRRMNLSGDERHPRYLGTTAHDEVATFWYRMNFGDSTRGMLPYFDEIELLDMVDIAGFVQTLPRYPWTLEEIRQKRVRDSLVVEEQKKKSLR